ncbi:hypothetical protein [Aliiruegeria lutimaris]|nr:hypothetical protein [Aliiruegeria lutimaris]
MTHPRPPVGVALFLALFILVVTSISPASSPWTATHWLFTYEHGFIKRGFMGSLHALVSDEVGLRSVWMTHIVVSMAASVAFCTLILRTVRANQTGPDDTQTADMAALAFGLMLLSGSGIVQQFFFDTGRFDVYGFLLLCAAFLATGKLHPIPALLTITFLSILAILIHEAFFFWIAPAALALWLLHHPFSRTSLVPLLSCAAAIVLVTFLAGHSSLSDHMTFEEAKSALQQRADFEVSNPSLEVHFRNLEENMRYTLQRALTKERAFLALIALTILGLQTVIFFAILQPARTGLGYLRSMSVLLCFCPIALVLFGHDHGRWLAMINGNLAVMLLAAARLNPGILSRLAPLTIATMLLVVLAQASLGPFGIMIPYPELDLFNALKTLLEG